MTDPLPAGAEDARVRPAPPVGRRFRKGQSGNPKGGPKRPQPRTADIEWLFSKSFTVVIDGEEQTLPLARALLLAMAHRALKGDGKAATELLALHGKAEETRAAQAAAKAKKAAEARARREEEEAWAAEEEAANPPPPIFTAGDNEGALLRLGVMHDHRQVRGLTHWAFDILTAAAPERWAALDQADRDVVIRALEFETPATLHPPPWPPAEARSRPTSAGWSDP